MGKIGAQLQVLQRLSMGPGAVRLPNTAQTLELKFKALNKFGHMGARKFWRENLPRIQFHNPKLAVSVIRARPARLEDQEAAEASLAVTFSDRPPFKLDVKNMRSEAILHKFVTGTDAQLVKLEQPPVGKPSSKPLNASSTSNSGLIDNLVNSKLVRSERIIAAMRETDRAHFSPRKPYDDAPQTLGHGATISAPHMHALALESLEPYLKSGASALDVGSGSGYLVAVMSRLVKPDGVVCGIEHIPELLDFGISAFLKSETDGQELLDKGQVRFRAGDGRLGWSGMTFDAIHVGAAAPDIPDELVSQLKSPGKMFIPVGTDEQYIYEVTKDENGVVSKDRKFGVSYVPLTDLDYYRH